MPNLLDKLYNFSSSSAVDYYELWLEGASLFIPQLNKLLEYTDYKFNIINIDKLDVDFNNYNELGNILKKFGSDKSTTHNYHIIYNFIFNKLGRNSNLNIIEIGLGTNNTNLVSNMGPNGKPGASLYAFREFLPNSNIYGADIDKDILFESERIKTGFVDQLKFDTFNTLNEKFGNIKYDLIIDDGLHSIGANFNTLLYALNNINKNGWIVIEDIGIIENWKSIDFILSQNKNFTTYIFKTKAAHIYTVNKVT